MLHLNIIKVKTPEEMGKAAADEFEAVICRKPACVMGLATGSTPLPLYRELIAREQAGKLDFSRVRSANLDEYKGLAPDHPQSYRRFMQENLFDHIACHFCSFFHFVIICDKLFYEFAECLAGLLLL